MVLKKWALNSASLYSNDVVPFLFNPYKPSRRFHPYPLNEPISTGEPFMSPQPKGRGTYWFWCGSRGVHVASCLHSRVDFDQTEADTLFGRGKDVIRFWWPWHHFHGHTSILNVKFWSKTACLHTISWTKWWILAERNVLYHWDS